MDTLLSGLRAAGEATRLRLLALCAHAELNVSDLTQLLEQSQPRVSRHLKLLVEAGLLARSREGAQVYFRVADSGPGSELAERLVDLLPLDDTTLQDDLARLQQIRERRVAEAAKWFRDHAGEWNEIRRLHVPEPDVETRLLQLVGNETVDDYLDIGTGTGRILSLLAPRVRRGVGIDNSAAMLAVARAAIEQDGLRHVHVRMGDMYHMPVASQSIDLATLHLVLHHAEAPGAVIAEAARTLRPGGRLLIVDFDEHDQEQLREEYRHHRLGFSDLEIENALRRAELEPQGIERLEGEPLTVKIWSARQNGAERPDPTTTR